MIEKLPQPSKKAQVIQLLVVLFSGMMAACLIGAYFLYYYNPSGNYLAKNVLLDVTTIEKLSIRDIVYVRYDQANLRENKISLSLEQYERFYELVANDRSLPVEKGESHFRMKGSHLKFYTADKKVYQQVDFSSDGEFYRVPLFEHKGERPFAYFQHANLLQSVFKP